MAVAIEVRVMLDCPLGHPGVVLVRRESLWTLMVDRNMPREAAVLAIAFYRTLAALANQADDGDPEDPAPSLPLPAHRRRAHLTLLLADLYQCPHWPLRACSTGCEN